jgi:biopolymer transport protein TolQ
MFDLIVNAGPVAKFVLVLLLVFSFVCWAIIFEKWWQLRKIRQETVKFLRAFREGRRHPALYAAAKKYRESPLARLYIAAYQEVASPHPEGIELFEDPDEGGLSDRLEVVNRSFRKACAIEVARLERALPFLATTASAAPFIGLFGTVWGIIAAFHNIGQQGSASLAVVAPGISEALIATAAGLAAAIPAVIGYNFFVNRVKHWATEMENFSLDLLNLFERPAPKAARPAKDGL